VKAREDGAGFAEGEQLPRVGVVRPERAPGARTTTVWVVDSGATSHCTGMKSHKWVRYSDAPPLGKNVQGKDGAFVHGGGG
jgi:hypothetical protein